MISDYDKLFIFTDNKSTQATSQLPFEHGHTQKKLIFYIRLRFHEKYVILNKGISLRNGLTSDLATQHFIYFVQLCQNIKATSNEKTC